ncbi:MAG: hypothetical protein ACE5OS_12115 [Anaerolineae bacterium]
MRLPSRTLTHPAVASALVALLLTALLYGDALILPLFSDDLVQIPWLESISWRELWSGPSPYSYYRPLWFTIWHAWGSLFGGLHPPGLHFLSLAAHFVATWLTGLLAAAWIRPTTPSFPPHTGGETKGGGTIPACVASALFAIFPFSRQVVPWASSFSYPLVTGLTLGAVLAYDRARKSMARSWLVLSLMLAGLAPLAHETGILAPVLVLLAEVAGRLRRRWPRPSWWPVLYLVLLGAELALRYTAGGADVFVHLLTPTDLYRNAGFLTQGLVFPTAPVGQLASAWTGLDPLLALWLVALPTLALLIWSGLRGGQRTSLILSLGWFAFAALPPLVTRKGIDESPRFLYVAAVGVSLLWAATLTGWLKQVPGYKGQLTAAVLLVLVCAPATAFIRNGMALYRMAGESIQDATEAARRVQPVLLVNLPMRLTPDSRIYPLGLEGVTPLPPLVTAEDLVYVHTGIHDAAEAVAFGIVAMDAPPGYTYRLFGRSAGWEELAIAVRQARAVYLTHYGPEHIHLVEAGAGEVVEAIPPGEPLARFRDRVALLDAICICDEDGQVHLTTYWRAEADIETDATVFVHLVDPDGVLVAQADGYPLLGMLPFWLWEPGQVVRDVRHFEPVPVGEYTVRLGIWELATGERWLATGYPDGIVPLPVHCP